jgi:hypothetical protein
LTHYIRYFDIQPPDKLCVTTYCDNSSLLTTEEEFHTRDVDSSSGYLKPDHDVIVTLRELRTNLPLRLASLHVRGYQDEECNFEDLPRPEQLNVLDDRIVTTALKDLCAFHKPTEFIRCPTAESIFVMLLDITPVTKAHDQDVFPEFEFRA